MKYVLFILALFLVVQSSSAQSSISEEDSVLTTIPKRDLVFTLVKGTSKEILKNSKKYISTRFGNDSVYVYQNDRNGAFMLIGQDSSYQFVDLRVPHALNLFELNVHYSFNFDSLGTNNEYLVLRWFGRNYSEHSVHSGSSEFLCNQTIHKTESIEHGVAIISLLSKTVLFQGLTEINIKESQVKYPGRDEREIKNETIPKVQFLEDHQYLSVFNHGMEDYDYWALYDELTFGIYQLVDDQYVLIVKK